MVHSPENTRQQIIQHFLRGKRPTQTPMTCPGKRCHLLLAMSRVRDAQHSTRGKGSQKPKELALLHPPLCPATPLRGHPGAKAPKDATVAEHRVSTGGAPGTKGPQVPPQGLGTAQPSQASTCSHKSQASTQKKPCPEEI